MKNFSRKVTFFTPSKVYSGHIDITSEEMRTIDMLNSANLYWKNPAEKSFENSIMLNSAQITIQGGSRLGSFHQLQICLSDIIFFTDDRLASGHISEKMRASTLALKNGEKNASIRILTKTRGDSFYLITGQLSGFLKLKSKHRYLPIAQASVNAITRRGESWHKEEIICDKFIGLAAKHIEACSLH